MLPIPGRFQLRLAAAVTGLLAVAISMPSVSWAASAASVPTDIPVALSTAVKLGRLDSSKTLSVDFVLPLTNAAGAANYAGHVSVPGDPLYGAYLTPSEFVSRYGADKADFDAVIDWAAKNHLAVTDTDSSRTLVAVSANVSVIETALSVHFYKFREPGGHKFFSADSQPKIPASIASRLAAVIGLSDYALLKPLYHVLDPSDRAAAAASGLIGPDSSGYGHGHYGAYDASDLNIGYGMPNETFNGSGQTLAVYEEGGFFPQDPVRYEAYNGLPAVQIVDRNVNNYGGDVDDLGVATEAALDIEMENAVDPEAKQIIVYEDGDSFDTSLLNVLAAVADDDATPILSISYGLDEKEQGSAQIDAEAQYLLRLADEGITVLAAAGDNGCVGDADSGLNVIDPGSDPFVTCVGGTSLYEFGNSSYLGEETWNHLGIGGGATGGGVSAVWSIPDYQVVDGNSIAVPNGGSWTNRNLPDVAAVGDPLTPVDVACSAYAGNWVAVGGTSVSTPIWAGYIGLVNQARADTNLPRIGFANPAIYGIGTDPVLAAADFHDIIDGNNGNAALFDEAGYSAGLGFDDVTGFGSMIGDQLLTDLASAAYRDVAPPDVPTGFAGVAGAGSVTLGWNKDKGAKGYFVYFVDAAQQIFPIAGTTGTSFTVTGLKNGALYEFYLGAVGAGGITYSAYPIYVFAGGGA
jgi:kumamolisin